MQAAFLLELTGAESTAYSVLRTADYGLAVELKACIIAGGNGA